jgi:hypothetical protein
MTLRQIDEPEEWLVTRFVEPILYDPRDLCRSVVPDSSYRVKVPTQAVSNASAVDSTPMNGTNDLEPVETSCKARLVGDPHVRTDTGRRKSCPSENLGQKLASKRFQAGKAAERAIRRLPKSSRSRLKAAEQ